jgi:hypothetical protein
MRDIWVQNMGDRSRQQELLLASIQILRISFVLDTWKLDSVIDHVFFMHSWSSCYALNFCEDRLIQHLFFEEDWKNWKVVAEYSTRPHTIYVSRPKPSIAPRLQQGCALPASETKLRRCFFPLQIKYLQRLDLFLT